MLLLWILENVSHPIIVTGTDRSSCSETFAKRKCSVSAKWKEISRFIDLLRLCLFACLSCLVIQLAVIFYIWGFTFFQLDLKPICMLKMKDESSLHMQEVHFPLGFLREGNLIIKMISSRLIMDCVCVNIFIYCASVVHVLQYAFLY